MPQTFGTALQWANVLGDALIVIAFYTIAAALFYFARYRKDLRYQLVFFLFSGFIFLSATGNLLAVVANWYPVYNINAGVKIITGALSIIAAVWLVKIIPRAMQLPSPAQLKNVNEELKKKTDELEKHNDFLQHLAYATAHDLREPARAVSIHAQMLLHKYPDKLDETLVEELKYLSDESRRLYTLIDSVIRYSYVESEEYKMHPVNLKKVAEQVKASLTILANDASAVITIYELPTINGNENLLSVLFQNIITNSIKFRKPDVPPVININGKREDDKHVIHVADNGIGFDNRYNEQVFEIFKRLNQVGVYRGAGLGLAVCKRIVELHNGSIRADSTPGAGTTIIIEFPA